MIQNLIERIFFGLYVLVVLLVFALIGGYFALSRDLPQLPDNLQKINLSLPTEIYSANGAPSWETYFFCWTRNSSQNLERIALYSLKIENSDKKCMQREAGQGL